MLGTLDAPAEVIPQIHRPTAFDQRLATASTTNKGNAAVEG
jgi:hypothetical protein